MTHSVHERDGKFHVLVRHNTHLYVFRYAYPTLYEADKVCSTLNTNFGFRGSIDNDLRLNYWPYSRMLDFAYSGPNENGNWYMFPKHGQQRAMEDKVDEEELDYILSRLAVMMEDEHPFFTVETWDRLAAFADWLDVAATNRRIDG